VKSYGKASEYVRMGERRRRGVGLGRAVGDCNCEGIFEVFEVINARVWRNSNFLTEKV
jgi:hypothetical protein